MDVVYNFMFPHYYYYYYYYYYYFEKRLTNKETLPKLQNMH